jgi:molecular chaperone DnaK (HSP70)
LRWGSTVGLVLVSLAALAAQRVEIRPDGGVVLEAASPALAADGRLLEHVGFETLGRTLTPILPSGGRCPCERTVSYTTALDDQTEIPIRVYRGNVQSVAAAQPLGSFEVVEVRPLPRGRAHVRVTLRADQGRIEMRAVDASDGRVLPLRRVD